MRSHSTGPRMRRRGAAGSEQVETVGGVEETGCGPGCVVDPVLPDDLLAGRVDDDDAVPVVVVDADESGGQYFGQTRVIEHSPAGRHSVLPEDAPGPVELDDRARFGVVSHDVAVWADLLWVRRIGQREVHRPNQSAGEGVLADPRAVDLGDQQVPVLERRVAVGIAEGGRGSVHTVAGAAELVDDPAVLTDDEDAAVVGIRDSGQTIGQPVGVVGFVQEAGAAAGDAGLSIGPEGSPARIRDLDDRVVSLLVGKNRPAVVDEERVIGKVERRRSGALCGKLPHDVAAGVDKQQPVVAAVRYEQVTVERWIRRAGRLRGWGDIAVRDGDDGGRRRDGLFRGERFAADDVGRLIDDTDPHVRDGLRQGTYDGDGAGRRIEGVDGVLRV